MPTDLQSVVFDRFTNPAYGGVCQSTDTRLNCNTSSDRTSLRPGLGILAKNMPKLLQPRRVDSFLEPTEGFEPTTRCLQNSRSGH